MRRMKDQTAERGFVLVTALILIAILSVLGAVGAYKAVIGTKVSGYAGDASRAEGIAAAGLNQIFWYWVKDGANCDPGGATPGCDERDAIMNYVLGNTTTLATGAPFVADLYAESLAALPQAPAIGGTTKADLDAYIQGSSRIRIYGYQKTGSIVTGMQQLANAQWGAGTEPQVAVWATSYEKQDPPLYPFGDPYAGCTGQGCVLVVYALGRDGDSRVLMREVQGKASLQLSGVSAITHAPPYANWMDFCHMQHPTAVGSSMSWPNTSTFDVVVEATQAPFDADRPSGTALIANTNMGKGGKKFRKKTNTTNELTMDSTPGLIYETHDPKSGVRVEPASQALDATKVQDPYPKLPTDLMISGAAADPYGKLEYFVSSDGQLFELDAYRWAAEQFTCQKYDAALEAAGTLGTASDPYANGAYCGRAEKLRQIVGAMYPSTDPADTAPTPPVTGRITIDDFWRNVRDGRPMFGIVRVMYPTKELVVTGESCEIAGGRAVTLYDVITAANNLKPGASYHGITLGNYSKVVVYGMLLMDYFTDHDNDGYFDADSERSLVPIESTDAYLKVEVPFLVNPAIPRNATGAFPTVASQTAPSGSTNDLAVANRINANHAASCTTCRGQATLATPYDGWIPGTEGLVSQGTVFANGSQNLMDLDSGGHPGNGLIAAAEEILGAQGATTYGWLSGGAAESLFSTYKGRLNYYYELMHETTDRGDGQVWPMTDAMPATLNDAFYIGAADAPSNKGDALHLLFPSGYAHGIKVALAALNLTADEWNTLLSGGPTGSLVSITDLYTAHNPRDPYGATMHPLGSPFGMDADAVDAGFGKAADLQANEGLYFSITKDVTTGYGRIDQDFKDLPALCYSGGLVDSHSYGNVSGIVYSPSSLEWEPGNKGGLSYITGAVITGLGMYNKSGGDKAHMVYVFDPQAVDNINTQVQKIQMQRYGRQRL